MPEQTPSTPESLGRGGSTSVVLRDELREKVLQLQLLSEELPIILWTTDMDLRCTSAWGAGLKGIQIRPADVVGLTVMDFLNTADMTHPTVAAHAKASQGQASAFEIELSGRQLEGHVLPYRKHDGEIIGTVGVAMDITEARLLKRELRESQDLYRILSDSVYEGIVTIDSEGRILFANPAVESLLGYAPQEIAGMNIGMLMPPELHERHRRAFSNYLETGVKTIAWKGMAFPALHKNGRRVDVEVSFAEIRYQGRHIFAGVMRDVSERKRIEAEKMRNELLLSDFFDNAPVGLLWVGSDGTILRANRAQLEMMGHSEKDCVGRYLSEFYADKPDCSEMLGLLIKGEAVVNREARLVCKAGGIRHVQINANVMWENGRFVHARFFTLDMTDLKRAREQLERLALYDPLTGLPNRAQFMNLLGRVWTRSAAAPASSFAVLFMDMDDLKGVNDRLGHAAGDGLLSGVGQAFQACLRPGDVAARLGGDEFAVLLLNVASSAEAAAIAERILAGLPLALNRRSTASLGIALSSGRYASPETMLNAADEAMYKVKRGKKAGYAFAYVPDAGQTFKQSM